MEWIQLTYSPLEHLQLLTILPRFKTIQQQFFPNLKHPTTPIILKRQLSNKIHQQTTLHHHPYYHTIISHKIKGQAGCRYNTNRIQTTQNNYQTAWPAVIFTRKYYMVTLANRCQYTIVGKFLNTLPRMKQIRWSFIYQTELRGESK